MHREDIAIFGQGLPPYLAAQDIMLLFRQRVPCQARTADGDRKAHLIQIGASLFQRVNLVNPSGRLVPDIGKPALWSFGFGEKDETGREIGHFGAARLAHQVHALFGDLHIEGPVDQVPDVFLRPIHTCRDRAGNMAGFHDIVDCIGADKQDVGIHEGGKLALAGLHRGDDLVAMGIGLAPHAFRFHRA